MQQILNGSKDAINQKLVSKLTIPNYPELSVKALYNKVKDCPILCAHLPDASEKKKPDKYFVWHLLYYFHRDFIEEAIEKAQTARAKHHARQDKQRPQLIVRADMLEKLSRLQLLRSKYLSSVSLNLSVIAVPKNIKNSIATDRTTKAPRLGVKKQYDFDLALPPVPDDKRPKRLGIGSDNNVNLQNSESMMH